MLRINLLFWGFRANMYLPKGKTKQTEVHTMNVKKMSYRELEKKVIENRSLLRTTKDQNLKRRLIAENHEMMVEMDSRWNKAGRAK